jgi:hypothetical protein
VNGNGVDFLSFFNDAGGKGTPYCLGFNPTAHTSGYILFWLPGACPLFGATMNVC